MSCPICGKPTVPDTRPFCSRRCADIDLGRWLGGGYRIAGEGVTEDTEGLSAGDPSDDTDDPVRRH